jgi:MoCo/4Fe-4S cofactor protein with predicted Tat translocation signal
MSTPKYWMATEELENDEAFLAEASKEFPTDIPVGQKADAALNIETNRRDFLKVMGFGVTAATLAACTRGPVKKAIPYVEKPDDIIPGVANWYASTAPSGNPVLVKTREGRPIKLEGNPDSPVTGGGLTMRDHATVLDLYDSERARAPYVGGNASNWSDVDSAIRAKLNDIQTNGGSVRFVSGSVLSPSTRQLINEFLGDFADGQHITYDALSVSALREAHKLAFGQAMLPQYRFDKAEVIVSFNCDFLGTWIAPAEYSAQWVVNRDPDKPMSRHLQFEGLMTLTGGKADMRFPLKPSDEGKAVLNLYNKVAGQVGAPQIPGVESFNLAGNSIDKAASELLAARGKGLVVSGTNDVAIQTVIAAINQLLGNYGNTLDIANPAYYQQGDDAAMAQLANELNQGSVDALFFYNANPVFNSPFGEDIKKALEGISLSVSFASKIDETAALCQYNTPDHHYLESWGDAQQNGASYSLIQPTIYPIFDTRQVQTSLLAWSGNTTSWQDYLKAYWETNIYDGNGTFNQFWVEALRKGVATKPSADAAAPAFALADNVLAEQANRLTGSGASGGDFELITYPTVALGDGSQANNPWLQEMPDTTTKVCWDQYVTVPYAFATENGVKNGTVVQLSINGENYSLPAVVQVGQAAGTLGLPLGFGRTMAGKVAEKANGEGNIGGHNAYAFGSFANGAFSYNVSGVGFNKTDRDYELAFTQTFNYLYDKAKGEQFGNDYDRSSKIVETTTSYEYNNGIYKNTQVAERKEIKKHLVTLLGYSTFRTPKPARNIHWKMAIDLNKCTGCGACVVSLPRGKQRPGSRQKVR